MDNNTSPHPLATESFSYSWLETESHHKTIPNSNINNQSLLLDEAIHSFYFDISNLKSNPSSLVHADKLFSNGLILPRFLEQPSKNYSATSCIIGPSSTPPSPSLGNSELHHHHHPSSSFRRMFLGKWRKFIPRKIFSKYVKCLIPAKETIGRGGATRVDDVNRLTWKVKNWSTNNILEVASSPSSEIGSYSSAYWSDIDENSIRDAIIYCKRSSGLC